MESNPQKYHRCFQENMLGNYLITKLYNFIYLQHKPYNLCLVNYNQIILNFIKKIIMELMIGEYII